ncbi:DUF1641 domain-containing protein [Metabacillus sp. RGM 3146]|uniref:DUF1641 domain-containing protein n=1 Tax=Metabacillus sp. RGM 3146 TaxID=3401092 RepID=UPI003B9B495D
MAKATEKIVRLEIPKEKIQEENLNELIEVLAENKDSLIKVVNLIKYMDENRNLDAISALVHHQDEVLTNFAKEANKPQNSAILSNVATMVELLGSLNFKGIETESVRATRNHNIGRETPPPKETGLFGLLRALNDPAIKRTITVILYILRGIGKNLGGKTATKK